MKKYNGKPNMIGKLIRRKREEIGMSANDVCQKLQLINISLNRAELCKIEREEIILKDFETVALCLVLNISIEDIKENYSIKKKMNVK